MHSQRFSTLPAIGILTLVYFIIGKLSLELAFVHRSAPLVWPPAGIASAALLVLGYRTWPAIFIGAFLVNVTTAGNVGTPKLQHPGKLQIPKIQYTCSRSPIEV